MNIILVVYLTILNRLNNKQYSKKIEKIILNKYYYNYNYNYNNMFNNDLIYILILITSICLFLTTIIFLYYLFKKNNNYENADIENQYKTNSDSNNDYENADIENQYKTNSDSININNNNYENVDIENQYKTNFDSNNNFIRKNISYKNIMFFSQTYDNLCKRIPINTHSKNILDELNKNRNNNIIKCCNPYCKCNIIKLKYIAFDGYYCSEKCRNFVTENISVYWQML